MTAKINPEKKAHQKKKSKQEAKPVVSPSNKEVIAQTKAWLKNVVIGLGLCPFAARPFDDGVVHFEVFTKQSDQSALEEIIMHCHLLLSAPQTQRETTLFILPNMLQAFGDFCLFIDWVNSALALHDLEGKVQIAHFHPKYCFDGVRPEDKTNLTNRAPYPIVHVLREESIEIGLRHYGDIDALIERNMQTMDALTAEQLKQLFPYIVNN